MAKAKKTTTPPSNTASPKNLVRAAAKAKKAHERLGSDNVKAALPLSGAAHLFTNIYMAMGFFMRLAEKPIGEAEQRALEARGREFFGKLGVHEDLTDPGTQTEVVVSVPSNQLERLDALYALGLKGSARSVARGFIELRGAAEIDKLRPLVAEMGGRVAVVERPPAPVVPEAGAPGPAAESDVVADPVDGPQNADVSPSAATIAAQPDSKHSDPAAYNEPSAGEASKDAQAASPVSAKIAEAVTAVLSNKETEKSDANPVPPFLRQDGDGQSSQGLSAATKQPPAFRPGVQRPIVPPNPNARLPGSTGPR